MNEQNKQQITQLFKTKPTKYELVKTPTKYEEKKLHTLTVDFEDVIVKVSIEERGCCVGRYYDWSLECEISENGGKDYKEYRFYPFIESLKQNKDIPFRELFKNNGCGI
jgi:hypothetical protein